MKVFKKIIAFTSACAVLCGSAVMMNASAVTYNVNYDTNRDDTVSIADVLALNKYLAGRCYVTNISQMDVNKNLIVDQVDVEQLMAYVTSTPFTFTYLDVTA